MIIRAEHTSIVYYEVTGVTDLNLAVSLVVQKSNHVHMAGFEAGGTSFKEVASLPDLRPLDEALRDGIAEVVQ